ncbi:MAG: GGDEF domain-containing protein [Myxococcota bacterium]
MSCSLRRALEGALCSLVVPTAMFVWHTMLDGHSAHDLALYARVLVAAVVPFSVFGALIGRSEDHLEATKRELDQIAVTDPTTGLKNVRYFRARLEEACAAAERDGGPLSLLIVDLDRFKAVNDRFGHPVGDAVLRDTACAIASVCRREETVARIGGEEFALLLPATDRGEAIAVAERVRRAVSQSETLVPGAAEPVRVTASVGVVSVSSRDDLRPDLVLSAADRALYDAKRGGRDRISAAPPAALASAVFGC